LLVVTSILLKRRDKFFFAVKTMRALCFAAFLSWSDAVRRAADLSDTLAQAWMASASLGEEWMVSATLGKSVFDGLKNLLRKENVMFFTGLAVGLKMEKEVRKTWSSSLSKPNRCRA
jgi:hypothetical protein